MAHYVDGFVIPLPKTPKRVWPTCSEDCGSMAGPRVTWIVRECVGDDLNDPL